MNEQGDAKAHPLNAIAGQFKRSEGDTDRNVGHEALSSPPPLSLLKLMAPAILIDRTLHVVWQNKAAYETLWHADDAVPDSSHAPSIFDLLLSSAFQNRIERWKEWLRFFLVKIRHLPTASELEQQIEALTDEGRLTAKSVLTDLNDAPRVNPSSAGSYGLLEDGRGTTFEVAVIRFESRLLMVFEPVPAGDIQHRESKMNGDEKSAELVQKLSQPTKAEISILAATLNDAVTLRTEMLDEEYSHLFMSIWQICSETITSFGGVVSQSGSDILGYFLSPKQSETDRLGAIQCALELKNRMLELGREWKIRKGWLQDIDLNIGIHTGVEYMASASSGLGGHILVLGETLDIAKHLAGIATGGQIWATKAVIHRLPEKELKSLRFGIFRTENNRQVFIARYFSRIRDLNAEGDSDAGTEGDMGACAVTQIFDRQGHG